jgi:glucose-1-phosphate adenylyltransferase
MTDVLAIILGGGQGKRLYPLTYRRSKPAVPIGGKYRLIDIPISNCLHAGIRRIFVLTQFNSASLNRHVGQTYRLDHFSQAFVDIIAAEQTPENTNWFQGTADAVRRAMPHFINLHADHYLILAGDHLYRMDFDEMVQAHVASGADITIAAQPTNADDARGMGIFRFDRKGQIEGFEEKPTAARLEEMGGSLPAGATTDFTTPADKPFVASMGIYVFTRKALVEALAEANVVDFGHEIIPKALGRRKVRAYAFNGYWADVGTLRSFFDANICLTQPGADFSFYHPTRPVFSRPRFLPPSWVDGGALRRTVVSDGASVCHAEVEDSIVGLRMQVSSGAKVKRAVLLGADEYDDRQTHDGLPPLGIGHDAVLENVIVDKNARIGDGAILVNSTGIVEGDGPGYVIREGIIVVPKGGVVPAGTRVGQESVTVAGKGGSA